MPLHPQARMFLMNLAALGRPPWEDMPVAEARETFNSLEQAFGDGPEMASISNQTAGDVAVRIFRPKGNPVGVIVYFHGGGWVLGNLDTHDTLCRRIAKESNSTVVAVDYRLSPVHRDPAALDDCYLATEWVSQNLAELGVPDGQLVVAGDSAGGNLAAAVSLRARDQKAFEIALQVLIYPVIEPHFETESYTAFAEKHGLTRKTMQWFWEQYLGPQSTAVEYAVPSNCELQGVAAAHVVTAEFDVLRDEGESFAEKLTAAGVPTTTKRYDGMLHGFLHFAGVFDDGYEAAIELGDVVRTALKRS